MWHGWGFGAGFDTGVGVMGEDGEFLLEGPEPVAAAGYGYRHVAGWYVCIGISKRTFFRWRALGEEMGDLPPFDEPNLLEGWYARMMGAGHFKHGFPRAVRDAVAKQRGEVAQVPQVVEKKSRVGSVVVESAGAGVVVAAAVAGPVTAAPRLGGAVSKFFGMDHGEERGLAYEIAKQENYVSSLGKARDDAYGRGEREEGDAYARRYSEELDALSLVKQRALRVLETEGKLVPREDVESDLAPRIAGVVIGGMYLYGRIREQMDSAADEEERQAVWKRAWMEHCQTLMQSQFLPVGITMAAEEVWLKAVDFVQGLVPPPLELRAA